jgi:flavin-dependent dehydrogenase
VLRETADVVVIGGGPAGSTAATMLKQYAPSRRVVVLEQARFPRHHVGESTLPDMNPILARLGVLERVDGAGFVRKVGITYKWSSSRPMFSEVFATGVLGALARDPAARLPDHSWQVDRSRYDAILLDNAREHGAEVREGWRATGVLRAEDRIEGVVAAGPDGATVEIRAGHVVDCSGQARVISRHLGLPRRAHALGDVAVYRYYRGMRWRADLVGSVAASKIFFSATPAGWMWFIPLSSTDVSVGLVTRREVLHERDAAALFDAELATVPELGEMLDGASLLPPPGAPEDPRGTLTVSDWSYSHDEPCGPGWFLAGDAAAFVDPILSSGILLAHHSGLSVANAIHTEWLGVEPHPAELRAGYARFYADLYGGFLVMARWWYHRRHLGIDDWLRAARELGAGARGSEALPADDLSAFMTFAAGYLTDFRFVNLGCAFGDSGLARCVDGLEQRPGAGDRLRRVIDDRTLRLRRRFDRVTVAPYAATDLATDRWWRLPEARFSGPEGERVYRPAIEPEQREEVWTVLTLRVLERLLGLCDGTRDVDEVVRATRDGLPAEHRARIHRLANTMLADLRVLGALA